MNEVLTLMKCEIEAVAFDIDGTIYPEWSLYLLLFPFMLKNFRFMRAFGKVRKDIRKKQAKDGAKLSDFFDEQAQMLATSLHKDKAFIKKELQDKIYDGWQPFFSKIRPYKNVAEVIKQLKMRGFKIALLSDFLIQQKGDVWGILPLCDTFLSSEETGALKPSPHPFLALASKLKTAPEKVLYVGNNLEYDIKGANAVGMKTAWIRRGISSFFWQEDNNASIVFSDYRQLLNKIIVECKEEMS